MGGFRAVDGPAFADRGTALFGRNADCVAGGVPAGKPLDDRGVGGAVSEDLIVDRVSSSNGGMMGGFG